MVPVKIGRKSYDLQYRYEELVALRAEFGEGYDLVISAAVNTKDVKVISTFISIGIRGELTSEEIFKISPPIAPMIDVIRIGLSCAYHGSKEPPEENPTRGAKREKMLILALVLMSLLSLWKWLSPLG